MKQVDTARLCRCCDCGEIVASIYIDAGRCIDCQRHPFPPRPFRIRPDDNLILRSHRLRPVARLVLGKAVR